MDPKPTSLDALRIDRSQAAHNKRGGWGVWLLVLLFAIAAGLAWWYMLPQSIAVQTAQVQARTANAPGSGRTLLNASGYVTSRLEATVSSKVTGKVAEIMVEEGMKVAKDQILARLDDSNVKSGLRLAEAQLDSSKLSLEETEPMLDFFETELRRLIDLESTRSVSRSERDKAQAEFGSMKAKLARQRSDVIVAERQLEDWKQQMEDTIIRAPFAGVVTTKDAQPGEMISPMSSGGFTRTGICTLVDMASMEIEVDVGESFINRVKPGQKASATLDAYPDWQIPCKVIAIIPTADRQKATVKVRVAFDALDPRILPQMGVKVAFQDEAPSAQETPKNLFAIPKSALQKLNGREVVWVVRDGKAERRAVSVQDTEAAEILISSGLALGESVVLNAPTQLADGTSVSIIKSK